VLLALLAPDKPPPVDVSAHLDVATVALWVLLGLALLYFVFRPELWRRLWLGRVDPRPAGLLRIVFGVVVLWTMVDLIPIGRFLFTDEGLWLTKMARRNYSGDFRTIWDPEHGFAHYYDPLLALWYRFSLFHIRSDPPFVWTIYGLTIVATTMMILGIKTRVTTLISWFLVNTIYVYSPIFYSGGDTVVRVYLFLGMLTRWGDAYSLDVWWSRKKAVLRGATEIPPLKPIPAWPLRLMMMQLAIIYCATGALKSGHTWLDGSALFFALNLDHFYRHPAQIHLVTFLQMIWVLPFATWITRIWETAFPVALLGAAVNAFERDKQAGVWPEAPRWRRFVSYACVAGVFVCLAFVAGLTGMYFYDPAYGPWKINKAQAGVLFGVLGVAIPAVALGIYLALRRYKPRIHRFVLQWLLGKRMWLAVGLIMHIGIDLFMNVGTFVQVMIAVYVAWLSGPELDAIWHWLVSKPQPPGAGTRPLRAKRWQAVLLAPIDRLRYRRPPRRTSSSTTPTSPASATPPSSACGTSATASNSPPTPPSPPASSASTSPAAAAAPTPQPAAPSSACSHGFWWMYPWCLIPGLSQLCGHIVRPHLPVIDLPSPACPYSPRRRSGRAV
jgi:hypothetical protein